MNCSPGQTLLHYRLGEQIGAGGMGEVWKAVDTTLGREVAIKVLPQVFSQDPGRLARFEREAKLLASLNHPNIAVVHGLHEVQGLRFLAMELLAPRRLRDLLQRCLEKEARERLRDIGDARIELARAAEKGATPGSVAKADARAAMRAFGAPLLAVALVAGALLGAALWHWLGPARQSVDPPSNAVSRFAIAIPDDLELRDVQISADGRVLAYIAGVVTENRASAPAERLYVRRFEELEAKQIAEAHDLRWSRFSPDGRWLAYLVMDATGEGTIHKVAVDGGPPVVLIDDLKPDRWYEAEWRKDDSLLFAAEGNLVRLPIGGGEPEDLLDVDADGETSVVLSTHSLPDGNTMLLGVGYLDEGGLAGRTELFRLDTRERRVLMQHGSNATYRSTGHIVFFGRDDTVLAVPFDIDSLELTGPEVPLMSLRGQADFSDNGTLVFQTVAKKTGRLVLVDREGDIELLDGFDSALPEGSGPMRLRWSPDGTRIAAAIYDRNEDRGRLWVHDLDRGTPVPLMFSGAFSNDPVWTPDGTHLAFVAAFEDRGWRTYRRPVDGSGSPEQFVEGDETEVDDIPSDWTADGTSLVFVRREDDSGDIWIQPSDSGATPRPLIATPANENGPRISPDGRWIAYQSDESGRNEIWVSPFSPSADAALGKKTRVSVDGGRRAKWSSDGRELFFLDGSGRILGAEVKSATKRGLPVFAVPRVVLDRPALDLDGPYDVSPLDGRFVTALREEGEGATNRIFVVLNWHTELVQRMR